MEILTSVGICPNVLKQSGNMLLVIEITEANVRIVSSNNYVPGDEFELGELFCIDYVTHFFPYKLLLKENFDYVGQYPSFDNFFCEIDTNETFLKKKSFYKSQNFTKAWSLKKEIMIHANIKLHLLVNAMLAFTKESFLFQQALHQSFSDEFIIRSNEKDLKNNYVNPFNYPICSLGGLIYEIYCLNYQNYFDIHCVKNEYTGGNLRTVSRMEHKFVSYMHYKNPEANFVSAFSCENGQKYFKESIPDLYCADTKKGYWFLGCAIHGHLNCLLNPEANERTLNPFGKTYKDLNIEFQTKIENLLHNHSTEITEAVLIWECVFKKDMETDLNLKYFLDHEYVFHPLQRLIPRNAMRGAFIDTYALKWNEKVNPDDAFYALDINGLYSYCAINFKFMTGKYDIIMGNKLGNITFESNKLFYSNLPITGAIFLKILPPQNLLYPFLMYRLTDGCTINTLCAKCAETRTRTFCKHSIDQRALIGTYMISEIEFALTLGYEILAIFEVHAYFDSDFILSPFVKQLNELKMRYTSVTPNSAKRNFYKLAVNTFFGKFSQRIDKGQILFLTSQQELEKHALSQNIKDIICLSDNVCMIETASNICKLNPDRKHSMYIGAQITAYGRQVIYSHLMTLIKTPKCKIFHVNCDSLYFTLPKISKMPFVINNHVGNFKNVFNGNIISYISFGPKQYCISYQSLQNLCTETRISGLSIHHTIANLDYKTIFETLLKNHEKQLFQAVQFPQTKKQITLKTMAVKYYSQKFTLSNNLTLRRYICYNSKHLDTLPFGLQS